MSGFALGNHLLLIFTEDLISKGDHPLVDPLQASSDNDRFIIFGGIPVTAMDIGYNELIPQYLQLGVAESSLSTKFRPPHLKPDQIICIISHSHLVCLRIPHSNIHIHPILH
jgi:hypothetical protein